MILTKWQYELLNRQHASKHISGTAMLGWRLSGTYKLMLGRLAMEAAKARPAGIRSFA